MKKLKWVIFVCLFFVQSLDAQDSLFIRMGKRISGSFTYVAPDGLGNVFAVTKTGQLRKYNSTMDSVGVYNDLKQLGRMHSIASFNALKTGVYFNQYKTILVLDRFLKEINRIDLRKAQLYQVNVVAQSFDNKWWVFDEQEAKLKKIGDHGKSEMETTDLRLLIGETISPVSMYDQQRSVYLYDPVKGLFIFDQLGAFKKKVALIGWKDIQPFGNGILGVRDGKMLVYSAEQLNVQEYFLPSDLKAAMKLCFTSEGGYALFSDDIVQFKWTLK